MGYAVGLQVKILRDFWIAGNTSLFKHEDAIKMVTIEDPPMVLAGKTTDGGCPLSHPCTKFVEDLGNLSSKDTRRKPQMHCCTGFMIEILLWLERDLGVQFDLYVVEDGRYGAYNKETKKWNGMIQDMIEEKAQIALAVLTATSGRTEVVSFSPPLIYEEGRILISSQSIESLPLSFGFLDPFDSLMWIVFLLAVNVVLAFVWLLERLSPYGHYKRNYGYQKNVFNLPVCMSYIWSTVFKLQLDDVMPRSASARFTAAVFSFVTLVLTTSYTANLAASVVSFDVKLPITGIHDPKVTKN